jgi:hypothetical protein
MSTMITTQERATPLVLEAPAESAGNPFSGLVDVISEIGYCLKLSAQSLNFTFNAPRADSSATRLDTWPVDLWVF